MKSDFKQKIKSAFYKDFFLRTKNEIEDSDDQPNSVLTKIYTDILYDNGTISDYELVHFEKEISKNSNFFPVLKECCLWPKLPKAEETLVFE